MVAVGRRGRQKQEGWNRVSIEFMGRCCTEWSNNGSRLQTVVKRRQRSRAGWWIEPLDVGRRRPCPNAHLIIWRAYVHTRLTPHPTPRHSPPIQVRAPITHIPLPHSRSVGVVAWTSFRARLASGTQLGPPGDKFGRDGSRPSTQQKAGWPWGWGACAGLLGSRLDAPALLQAARARCHVWTMSP